MKVQIIAVYGACIAVSLHDDLKDFGLFMIEVSGACYEYYVCASDRGKQLPRNEIVKKIFREYFVLDPLPYIVKILLNSYEE